MVLVGEVGRAGQRDAAVEQARRDLAAKRVGVGERRLLVQRAPEGASPDGGRAAMVLPDNCLFEGKAGEVFKILMDDCNLHTVLRLPRGTFTPYSQGVKANVVFFQKGRPTEEVWIFDARSNVPGITKKDRPLAHEHFAEFVKCYGSDPNALKSKALTDTAKGIYLPYWTFDAHADATWTAEAGAYYYTREGGKQVQRVRWRPASGAISHDFDDDLVAASLGVDAGLLRAVEPFPTADALVPYDPGYLSGWTVERYQIDLVGAAMHGRFVAENKPGATMRSGSSYSTWWNGGLRTVTYFHNMIGLLTESIGNSRR